VLGGAAVSGNAIIVFTRTSHDKAEDFMVRTSARLPPRSSRSLGSSHSFVQNVTTAPVEQRGHQVTRRTASTLVCASRRSTRTGSPRPSYGTMQQQHDDL